MAAFCKLIPQISTFEKNWTAKIIVAGKQAPKTAQNNISQYQEVLAPNAKRALFQTRDQKTETRSKKKMKTDKHVEDADVLSSG
ncbi:Hypothetical predicted protein [Olea europaea subsp. europaea]|uniref:Uncharacterized protein n=1 Tax=Olea europaea subsp. europaea TaxID=158383 RepID=A0A8S0QYE5_OLEEU|nr:Hypothetical predicted protein [Olea europaea subsp. europaea]